MGYFDQDQQQPPVPLVPAGAPQGAQQPATPAPAPVPQGAPSPLADPDFNRFLAQRSKEIAAAQKDANERERWAQLGNTFERAGDIVAGRQTDTAAQQAKLAQARQPIADALQRFGVANEAVKDYGAQQEIGQRATAASFEQAKRDPNSAVSKRVQALWAPILGNSAQYLSAADAEEAAKAGTIGVQQMQALAQQKQAAAELSLHQGQLQREAARDAEASRHNRADEAARLRQLEIEGQRAAQEMNQKGRVPENEAAKIVNMGQALQAIDQLEAQYKKAGILAPNENSKYALMVDNLAPAVAAGAAPQARENAELMKAFKAGLPSFYTRESNGTVGFQALRDAVHKNMNAQIAALQAGGYKPEQIAELQRQSTAAAGPRAAGPAQHPQDAEAVAWAKANPKDPRSAAILKANGIGP